MKIQYKLSLMALGVLALTSCEKHDPFADNAEIGQYVPTAYWELGSTACKAGESFSFSGKYYTEKGYTPDRSEVWYSVVRKQESSATLQLAGSLLSYNLTIGEEDTVRTMLKMAEFPHSMAEWDGYEYVIVGEVPTSSTLAPLRWAPGDTWDDATQERFDYYFPKATEKTKSFTDSFTTVVVKSLQDDASHGALRKVFCDYPFTNAQITEVNTKYNVSIPLLSDKVVADPDPQAAVTEKSDNWYYLEEANNKKIVGYYYNTLVDGKNVPNEVAIDDANLIEDEANGNFSYKVGETLYPAYPVYDAAAWLFCRYDNSTGSVKTTVRPEYMPAFAELLTIIKFEEWILGNDGYVASFNRKYELKTQFKVVDTAGNVGKAYDTHTVSIN